MQQVLFRIPLNWFNPNWPDIPIFTQGVLLFLIYIAGTWLASRLRRAYAQRKEQAHHQTLATLQTDSNDPIPDQVP